LRRSSPEDFGIAFLPEHPTNNARVGIPCPISRRKGGEGSIPVRDGVENGGGILIR